MPDANNSDLVFSHNRMAFNKKKKKGFTYEAILTCTDSEFRDKKFRLLGKVLKGI